MAVFLGAFAVNYLNGALPAVAAGIALGNTLEVVIGAYLLKRTHFRRSLDRVKDVLALVFLGAIASTLISATIGTFTLFAGRVITFSTWGLTFLAWWVGDMLSDLTVFPLILVWMSLHFGNVTFKRFAEAIFISTLVILVGLLVFTNVFGFIPKGVTILYFVFPLIIWAAMRFGQRGGVSAVFAFSIVAIWGTIEGFSPYALDNVSRELLYLQGFIGVMSLTSMFFAAVVAEREAHERRKDDFISIASHELKTPLTTISSYTELLSMRFKKEGDAKALLYLERMGEQIKRLSSLVFNLLDVSRIQSGKLDLHKERVKFNLLVQDIVEDMNKISNHHQIIFENKTNVIVRVDRFRITQVVTNLISNAIKYSPKSDSVIVTLAQNKKNVTLRVQDFGIGIDRADIKHIFDRFFQAKTRVRQSFSGLGLGLFICAEIVKQHNGQISVSSTRGKGSTFSLMLPRSS
ncbi:MASE1 domain-containing protein [Candidatus Curtissbacteria bacterium]|nr:MASE1 domain-containing protein [Candidatus Curtissbacteria bacterium]